MSLQPLRTVSDVPDEGRIKVCSPAELYSYELESRVLPPRLSFERGDDEALPAAPPSIPSRRFVPSPRLVLYYIQHRLHLPYLRDYNFRRPTPSTSSPSPAPVTHTSTSHPTSHLLQKQDEHN